MNDSRKYAVCIKNEGYEESLEIRKIYEIIADPTSESRGFVRVVDEDDDYLYPASWFLSIDLPAEIESAIAARG